MWLSFFRFAPRDKEIRSAEVKFALRPKNQWNLRKIWRKCKNYAISWRFDTQTMISAVDDRGNIEKTSRTDVRDRKWIKTTKKWRKSKQNLKTEGFLSWHFLPTSFPTFTNSSGSRGIEKHQQFHSSIPQFHSSIIPQFHSSKNSSSPLTSLFRVFTHPVPHKNIQNSGKREERQTGRSRAAQMTLNREHGLQGKLPDSPDGGKPCFLADSLMFSVSGRRLFFHRVSASDSTRGKAESLRSLRIRSAPDFWTNSLRAEPLGAPITSVIWIKSWKIYSQGDCVIKPFYLR